MYHLHLVLPAFMGGFGVVSIWSAVCRTVRCFDLFKLDA